MQNNLKKVKESAYLLVAIRINICQKDKGLLYQLIFETIINTFSKALLSKDGILVNCKTYIAEFK